MSLIASSTIDLITKPLPGDACSLVLYVVDSGDVADELQRHELLVKKLANYASHVMSPKFKSEYPAVRPQDILVKVLWTTPPTSAMEQVTAIKATGHEAVRLRVIFVSYRAFHERLRDGGG